MVLSHFAVVNDDTAVAPRLFFGNAYLSIHSETDYEQYG
jgi:hypothetical protein